MTNPTRILNWLGFIAFATAFLETQRVINLPQIHPYSLWLMLGASLISFFLGNSLKWLGIAVVVFGWALHQNWLSLNLGSISFNPIWTIFSGYLILFMNSR
ncbi:MAG: hypothetical protein MUE85_21290 [Microscillaceae bacterium]|jgi:hypothetical protein|nr:hypothetical protein [Microscillaceae bacterium]